MKANPRYSAFEVGEGSYGYPDVVFYDAGAKLVIGRYCSIAPGVTILLGGEHHLDWVTTYPFSLLVDDAKGLGGYPYTRGDVIIGNDVWIGYDAMILSGIKIGDGAVIAARSVVTKDVEPYSIVAGNPARLLRLRFPEHIIEALREISWWNWPAEKIKEAWPMLQSDRIEEFIRNNSQAQHLEKERSGVRA